MQIECLPCLTSEHLHLQVLAVTQELPFNMAQCVGITKLSCLAVGLCALWVL